MVARRRLGHRPHSLGGLRRKLDPQRGSHALGLSRRRKHQLARVRTRQQLAVGDAEQRGERINTGADCQFAPEQPVQRARQKSGKTGGLEKLRHLLQPPTSTLPQRQMGITAATITDVPRRE